MNVNVTLPAKIIGEFLALRLEEIMINVELRMLICIKVVPSKDTESIEVKYNKYLISDEDIKQIMEYDKNSVNFFELYMDNFHNISDRTKNRLREEEHPDVNFIQYCANFFSLITDIMDRSTLIVSESL